jgi:hypothetical protein
VSAPHSPLRSLTESEVMRELLSLCLEAGAVERRMLLTFHAGHDYGVKDNAEALATLYDKLGASPHKERCMMLYFARRLVAHGQRTFGVLSPRTDPRQFDVEALEEDSDGCAYRMIAEARGRPDGFLNRSLESFRDALSRAVERELL